MTSLVLQFNEAAVAAMEGNTRLRVLMKKRGGKEYLGLRPSYRVSGKNMQLMVTKNDEGMVSSELPANFIKDLKFTRPEHNTAFFLKNIGYGWFILDELAADATPDTPTVVVADSAHIKQAAKQVKAVEQANADKKADEADKKDAAIDAVAEAEANAQTAPAARTEAATPTPLTEEQKAGVKSSADELAAHFGFPNGSDEAGDKGAEAGEATAGADGAAEAGASAEASTGEEGTGSAAPAPAAKKTAKAKPASKASTTAAKSITKVSSKKPAAKKTAAKKTAAA
jgi:hypothetical protein